MRGDRLRELRKKHGYTQAELATHLNTYQNQIRRWESNEVIPSSESVVLISKFFGVTADYILGLVDTPQGKIELSDLSPDEQELIFYLRSGLLPEIMKMLAILTNKPEETPEEAVKR